MFDGKAFGEQIVAQVKSYLERATAPFLTRLETLETQVKQLPSPQKGDPGEPGKPGPAISDIELADAVEAAVALAVKDIPTEISTALAAAVKDLPAPAKGEKGDPGPPVPDWELAAAVEAAMEVVMKDLPTAEQVNAQIAKLIDAFPKAKDGLPGKDAAPTPTAFLISEEGELVSVYPDGEKQIIGKVKGEDGKRGASIMDGSVSDDGQLSLRMSDGRVINVGMVRGKDGLPGPQGKATHGRDAAELVILPGIDEARSYPAGTCAMHRGGTIRAGRETDAVVDGDILSAGWMVMLEGICEESETDLDNGRQVVRRTVYTSGKTLERTRLTSNVIYRGVWKEADWQRGDAATWDGSTWHCERPTKDKPGTSEDWRLMTKRGRDAPPVKH